MADSTSRWAEALREISSRLQELPGEEGYPTYLPSRLGAFYERAGRVRTLGGDEGSITIIGAVSPPGGDFSEPVTQASLRISSAYWALDYDLAHRRHFPAIDWLSSYSLTAKNTVAWFKANLDENWPSYVARLGLIFEREKELAELVSIVGLDTLQEKERLEYESARILREGYLRQSSFSSDAFCSLSRQAKLLGALLGFIDNLFRALKAGKELDHILGAPLIEQYIRLAQAGETGLDEKIEKLATQTEFYFFETEEI
jgi:V/A-type H+-transporting ATPase subunit A